VRNEDRSNLVISAQPECRLRNKERDRLIDRENPDVDLRFVRVAQGTEPEPDSLGAFSGCRDL